MEKPLAGYLALRFLPTLAEATPIEPKEKPSESDLERLHDV